MKLYIAEKPSLGRAIAAVLMTRSPEVKRTREYIMGKDWCVAWAVGHLFQLEEPDFYIKKKYPNLTAGKNGRLRWDLEHLPIIPAEGEWANKLVAKTSSLFKAIKELSKDSTSICHAGDPDRAGQQIVDVILEAINYKKPVTRVLISGMDTESVTRGLDNEKDNKEFQRLSHSEECRSRADWLYGMNFSRAVTMKAQQNGYNSVVSIGRVQTAVASLVVDRDLEIDNFVPKDYYIPIAKFSSQMGEFKAKWKPLSNQSGLDDEGRLLNQQIALQLQQLVKGQSGVVSEYKDEIKTQGAPLPFSLAKLQGLAGKKYGYSAQVVLDTVQSLYEGYKCVSYPRVDTGYLPESQHSAAKMILDKLSKALSLSNDVIANIDPNRKSYAWNDKKVTAHHGIIPTGAIPNMASLSEAERNIYKEISLRYAAQFMPLRKYRAVSVVVNVKGQLFATSGSTTTDFGWRALYGHADVRQDDDDGVALPPLSKGDNVDCTGLEIESKKTQPPKHFVESTLLDAMINIHRYVTDPQVKAIFEQMRKDADSLEEAGMGTPATRHTFLPRLVKVGLLKTSKLPRGKELVVQSTDAGKALIASLPGSLGKPDMTALWEATLSEIEAGTKTKEDFMRMQGGFITNTVKQLIGMDIVLPSSEAKPTKAGSYKRTSSAGSGSSNKECPKCGSALRERKGGNGLFLGCSGYPNCKHTEQVGG